MIDKYDNLMGEEILHTQQHRIIEKANLTTSPLKKELEKQVNTIEDKGEKQNEAIEKQSVVSCKNDKNDDFDVYNRANKNDIKLLLKKKNIS